MFTMVEARSIEGVNMQFEENKITALISPSESRENRTHSLNRMNDTIDIAKEGYSEAAHENEPRLAVP